MEKVAKKPQWIRGALAVLGLWVALCGWAFSSPVGSSPDDDFHIGSIWCSNGFANGVCEQYGPPNQLGIQPVLIPVERNYCYAFDSSKSGFCVKEISNSSLHQHRANVNLYPSTYYRFQSVFVTDNPTTSIYLMRVANATIACIFIMAALFLNGDRFRKPLFAAWALTLIPLGLFIVASINPSAWAYIGLSVSWLFQISAMLNMSSSRFSHWIAWFMYLLSCLLCIWARSDAAVYIVFSSVLFLIIGIKLGAVPRLTSFVVPALVCILAFLAVNSTNQGKAFEDSGEFSDASFMNRFVYNSIHMIEIPSGALGLGWGLGWLDTVLPPVVGIIGISLIAITLSSSLSSRELWRIVAIAGLLLFGFSSVMFVLSQGGHIVGELVQPRYVLPLIPLLVAVATAGNLKFQKLTESKVKMYVVISLLIFSQSVSIFTNIRRYVTGLDKPLSLNLNANQEWWYLDSISPMALYAVTTIGFGVFLVLGWQFTRDRSTIDPLSRKELT
jgi:hypothetical protein